MRTFRVRSTGPFLPLSTRLECAFPHNMGAYIVCFLGFIDVVLLYMGCIMVKRRNIDPEGAHLKNMTLTAGNQTCSILPPLPGPTYQAFLTRRHDSRNSLN